MPVYTHPKMCLLNQMMLLFVPIPNHFPLLAMQKTAWSFINWWHKPRVEEDTGQLIEAMTLICLLLERQPFQVHVLYFFWTLGTWVTWVGKDMVLTFTGCPKEVKLFWASRAHPAHMWPPTCIYCLYKGFHSVNGPLALEKGLNSIILSKETVAKTDLIVDYWIIWDKIFYKLIVVVCTPQRSFLFI